MHEKTLFTLIGLLLAAILGVGVYAAIQSPKSVSMIPATAVEAVTSAVAGVTSMDNDEVAAAATAGTQATTSGSGTQSSGTYTMAQVAIHNSSASCYTTINGSVYDLTPFIDQHPGGSVILSLCGIDGTAGFEGQHGGQRRPESELARLKIGIVAR